MSEKRFYVDEYAKTQRKAVYHDDIFMCFADDSESLVGKLNEQQSIITEQNKRIDGLVLQRNFLEKLARENGLI